MIRQNWSRSHASKSAAKQLLLGQDIVVTRLEPITTVSELVRRKLDTYRYDIISLCLEGKVNLTDIGACL